MKSETGDFGWTPARRPMGCVSFVALLAGSLIASSPASAQNQGAAPPEQAPPHATKTTVKKPNAKKPPVKTLRATRQATPAAPTNSAAAPAPAQLQAQASAAPVANAHVEDVVITATLLPEKAQKVPVAVTVVDGAQAAQANLNTINDITQLVPSLNFRDGASNKDQGLFIRGVGTVTTSPGAEPSVSTVVDGVALARPGQATLDLFDVERIEVLKGPQGTLFGKNASAGVVNVTTAQPTSEFRGYGDASWYSGGEKRFKAGVSGALVPGVVNGLLSVVGTDYDGNVANVYNGDKVNGSSHYGARAKFEITPQTSDLRALLTLDYLHTRETNPTGVVTSTNTTYPGGVITPNPTFASLLSPVVASSSNRSINANTFTHADDDNGGVSLQLDYALLGHTLTSITAYRFWKNEQFQDFDRTSNPANKQVVDHGTLDFNQVSEELRLASARGQFIEYVAGLYVLHSEDSETYRRTDTLGATTNTGFASYGVTNTNIAAFNENTINFTPVFRGIAGARVIGDDLGYRHERQSTAADTGIAVSSPYTTGHTFKTGYAARAGLEYDATDWATTYATYSHGYKGPAYNVFFNMVPATQGKVLAPETSNSFEIGAKTKLFDNRVLLNLAAFHTVFDNYQANFPNLIGGAVVTNLVNAGTVTSQGVEADFNAAVTDELSLKGAAAYTDAAITSTSVIGRNWPIKGGMVPFTPKWKANVRADYTLPWLEKYSVDFGTALRWQSKVQYDLSESPDTIQKAYGIWDADVTISDANAGLKVAFLVKNILNTSYATYLQSQGATAVPGTAGYVYRWVPRDDGRYFGVNIRKEF
ncbi:iron complex outermembrane recepter protein [Rhodoblastus acidophilus]|uniref:Iron complex outermembrane recepter protein n=1 Tax=Rhodoblastus acidophilus TaxID=1074 RepID=A0A212S910_RHOAC|nr:TonB-dependent receptor [Rhodoblastus acidophilus]SNB81705.1 iron complex outermembrane recepter protein [Rhodoblastus acidophilus]